MEVLIPIFFFFAVAAVWIVALTTRHRERMTMVEKGLGTEEIKALFAKDIRRDPLSSLKWGIIFVFGGAGVFLVHLLHNYYDFDEGALIVGISALFLGAGLLLFYFIASKKLKA